MIYLVDMGRKKMEMFKLKNEKITVTVRVKCEQISVKPLSACPAFGLCQGHGGKEFWGDSLTLME